MGTSSVNRSSGFIYVLSVLAALVFLFFTGGCTKKAEQPVPDSAQEGPVTSSPAPAPATLPPGEETKNGGTSGSAGAEPGPKTAQLAPEAGLSWNVWIESDGWVQKNIRPNTTATVALDLAKYVYAPQSAIPVGPDLSGYVKEEAQRRSGMAVIVRATLLGAGDRVVFGLGADTQQPVPLDLARLANSDDQAFAAEQHALSASDPDHLEAKFSAGYAVAKYRVPVTVRPGAPDCFQIAFTIWDRQDARPLDHVVFTAATAEGGASASCGVPRLQGGFGAMAGALSSAGTTKTAASLYIFEYRDVSHALQTRAVFVDLQGGAASTTGLATYSWSIPSSLTAYLNGKDLQAGIRAARDKEHGTGRYTEVAAELKSKFFPFDKFDDKHSSARAFEKLASLPAAAGQTPTVLVRYVSAEGKHIYAPLAILNASPVVKRKFQVSYPLPREDYGTRQCIGEYSFAYPKKLSGRSSTLDLDGVATALPKDRFRRLENQQQLRCYLNLEGDACEPDATTSSARPGEALVLLAHQSNGLLWYTDDRVLDHIVIDDERRTFAPGSVAFLSACSVLNSGENADLLATRLNQYGVDAIVASPFPVDIDYGVLLSQNLVWVMTDAYAKKETLNVQQIFQRAVDRIKAMPAHGKKYGEMAFEFLVLGNGQLTTCR